MIIHAALVNNLVLTYLVAVQDQLSFSKRLDIAWITSIAVLLITSISVPINYLAYRFIITPLALHHLSILVFMINIFLVVGICGHFLRKKLSSYQKQISVLTLILSINPAIVGATLVHYQSVQGVFSSLCLGIGTGAGFGLLLLIFTQLRERIQLAEVPSAFRELPILFITLAIISMAFTGLTGIGP